MPTGLRSAGRADGRVTRAWIVLAVTVTPGFAVGGGLPFVPVFQAELSADDGGVADLLGWSVAMDDGIVVAGAPGHDPGGVIDAGSVVVFRSSGLAWAEEARLVSPDVADSDEFGFSVAIDGDTLAVGARYAGQAGGWPGPGAAYVFERRAGAWVATAKLVPPIGAIDDMFGFAVALDGDVLAVGAIGAEFAAERDAGAVFVYRRADGAWAPEATLRPQAPLEDALFGRALAIEGDRLVVGAPRQDVGPRADAGAVYVFERDAAGWRNSAVLSSSDAENGDAFGITVGLSGDTIATGAALKTVGGHEWAGAAYVFDRGALGWTEAARLASPVPTDIALFGFAIALAGNDLIVGAPAFPVVADVGLAVGEVDAFARVASAWTGGLRLVPPASSYGGLFGWCVAMRPGEAVVGAIGRDDGAGSAVVFGIHRTVVP